MKKESCLSSSGVDGAFALGITALGQVGRGCQKHARANPPHQQRAVASSQLAAAVIPTGESIAAVGRNCLAQAATEPARPQGSHSKVPTSLQQNLQRTPTKFVCTRKTAPDQTTPDQVDILLTGRCLAEAKQSKLAPSHSRRTSISVLSPAAHSNASHHFAVDSQPGVVHCSGQPRG